MLKIFSLAISILKSFCDLPGYLFIENIMPGIHIDYAKCQFNFLPKLLKILTVERRSDYNIY